MKTNRQPGSGQHRRDRRTGFTLVEIIITLSIIALLLGVTMLSVNAVSSERKLREPAENLKDFAKQARMYAIVEQRPHQVLITPRSIHLQASGHLLAEEFISAKGELLQDIPSIKKFVFDEDIRISIRRWREQNWREVKLENWVFEHSGICEPLSIRFDRLSDGSYLEMTFNPLTASVEEESSEFH